MGAFFEHLERIVQEAAPEEELLNAQRYLSDSFPLRIDTPGKIASLVADLRIFGLPDDYWDTYRSSVRAVTSEEALHAAQTFIQPDRSLIVVVGNAAEFADDLRRYGPVTVVDPEGAVQQRMEAVEAQDAPGCSIRCWRRKARRRRIDGSAAPPALLGRTCGAHRARNRVQPRGR